MESNRCPFGSVGALIEKDGHYLMLYRSSFPPGLAGIAGHGEPGESPENSLRRELTEEAGIVAGDVELVLHKELPNPCKKGFTSHEWWLYRVHNWTGEPRLMEPDKHTFVKFMSVSEILEHDDRGDMDPAWSMLLREPEIRLIDAS
jgi:8-oxo-dGTP pyrophosphatase MutT (NUDIX family)